MEEMKPGWKTTEFWIALAGQLLGLLAVLGVVNSEAQAALSDALTKAITAAGVVLANVLVVWKYISARASVKQAHVEAQAAVQITQSQSVAEVRKAEAALQITQRAQS